jgi:hypothetical protein
MSRTVFLYALLITLLVAGCGQSAATPEPLKTAAPKPSTSDLPALDGAWTIKMDQSGGIMGLSHSIDISSDGKFTVVDQRTDKAINGELSAVELSNINELVTSAKYISASKPDGMACADCFIYDLEIQANGEKFAVQLNDISLSNSGLEPLVSHLRGLIETALK